jgi:hypothetical protein
MWTVMAVIAGAAVSLGVYETMRRRVQAFRLKAWYHHAASHQLAMEGREFFCGFGLTKERLEAIAAERRARQRIAMTASEYHEGLHKKYQRAAERPWLPVDPDPPPPPEANPRIVTADDY